MGEGDHSRADGKQQKRSGLKETTRISFHSSSSLLASCLAVGGAHLMCRQTQGSELALL